MIKTPLSRLVFCALLFMGVAKLGDFALNLNIFVNTAIGIIMTIAVFHTNKNMDPKLFSWKRFALLFLIVVCLFAFFLLAISVIPNSNLGLLLGGIFAFLFVGGFVWWIGLLSKK